MNTGTAAEHEEALEGKITVKLRPGKSLDEFCEKHFDNYDRDRFEAVAIRFFFAKERMVTLYSLDKSRQEGHNFSSDKVPVKKFKMSDNGISMEEFMAFVSELNFTLSSGSIPLSDMEVINK
ncbi:MAG: hypothetical protein ACXVPQ_05115 [Bacteroidia bacterium]